MPKKLQLRTVAVDEQTELERISRSRTEEARRVERAQILLALATAYWNCHRHPFVWRKNA